MLRPAPASPSPLGRRSRSAREPFSMTTAASWTTGSASPPIIEPPASWVPPSRPPTTSRSCPSPRSRTGRSSGSPLRPTARGRVELADPVRAAPRRLAARGERGSRAACPSPGAARPRPSPRGVEGAAARGAARLHPSRVAAEATGMDAEEVSRDPAEARRSELTRWSVSPWRHNVLLACLCRHRSPSTGSRVGSVEMSGEVSWSSSVRAPVGLIARTPHPATTPRCRQVPPDETREVRRGDE